MMRIIGWVVLCLALVFGLGLYLGWFNISTSDSGVNLSVNKDKVHDDVDAVKKKGQNLLGEKTLAGPIERIEMDRQELTLLDNKKQDVTIKADAATRIKIRDKDATFSDLAAGDSISVLYEAKKDGNVARSITVAKKS